MFRFYSTTISCQGFYMEIRYINRSSGQVENEKVFGEKLVEWLYNSKCGNVLNSVLIKKPLSRLVGRWYSSKFSVRKIKKFIVDFSIDMDQFLDVKYSSFNDFFIRRFKKGIRTPVSDDSKISAFAEGRYFAYEFISDEIQIPVKGKFLSARSLIGNESLAEDFIDGPLLLARLCPVDYHRFHFPLDGVVTDQFRISGNLHSVNPLALSKYPDCLIENERDVTIIKTERFGKVAMIEVGAICVGKIVQSYSSDIVKKFAEKGYFLFGGSTVILIGQKDKWKPSADLIQNTFDGIETLVNLGEEVGELK